MDLTTVCNEMQNFSQQYHLGFTLINGIANDKVFHELTYLLNLEHIFCLTIVYQEIVEENGFPVDMQRYARLL